MGCVQARAMSSSSGTKVRATSPSRPSIRISRRTRRSLARFGARSLERSPSSEQPSNTIQVYDFGKTEGEGILYIVMEFVLGQNLARETTSRRAGRWTPRASREIMNQVCGSLEEAHADAGSSTRDLKPDNIVLTERAGSKDFVKVLDLDREAIERRGQERTEADAAGDGAGDAPS